MKRHPETFIEHILECLELIEEYTEGITKENFINSVQLQDAVIRRIEIIGEAVKNLPVETKNNYPNIPWKEIAGMRDVLIHGYFGVDLELTWNVVEKEVQKLKESMNKVKKDLQDMEK